MIILRNLTEEDYQREIEKIERKNIQKRYRLELKERKEIIKSSKMETSKIIMIYLMVLFNFILVYSMVAMWVFEDLSYLGVLISDIAAQVIAYAIYCLKAYHGKRQEEQIKIEREKIFGTTEELLDEESFEDLNDFSFSDDESVTE